MKVLFLSDLHDTVHPALAGNIRMMDPDLILIGGDMMTRRNPEETLCIMEACAETAQTFYAFGNHETRRIMPDRKDYQNARGFLEKVCETGVRILDDESAVIRTAGNTLEIAGANLSLDCYLRTGAKRPKIRLSEPDPATFTILLAHMPNHPDVFSEWGADLTLSGHNHGGVVRLGNRGLITPQLHILEKYCHGAFHVGNMHLIVTSGLGEKKYMPRFLNPKELVEITLVPYEC